MAMVENEPQPDAEDAGEVLTWRIHPVAERPWQGLMLIGIIGLSTWIFWGVATFYGIFCLIVLCLAMAPFFLPTTYELDEEGIEITSLFFVRNFRPWSDFRSFYADNVGAQLSPFGKPSRLAVFRGNFIRFTPDNRERVIALLNEHIKRTRRKEEADDEA